MHLFTSPILTVECSEYVKVQTTTITATTVHGIKFFIHHSTAVLLNFGGKKVVHGKHESA